MPSVAIKISEELAEAARAEALQADRSLTGQIEHWAKIGRGAESTLSAQMAHLIKRFGGDPQSVSDPQLLLRLREALTHVHSSNHREKGTADFMNQNAPLYEADPLDPAGIVQVRPDGSKIRGRLENRVFVPVKR